MGEDLVVELIGQPFAAVLGGRGHGRVFAGFAGGVLVGIGHVAVDAVDIAGLFAFAAALVVLGVRLLAFALALFGGLVGALGLVGLLVVAVLFVAGVGVFHLAFGHEVEVAQQGARGAGEFVLVLVAGEQLVERIAALVLDFLAPQIDQGMARGRHGDAGQLFAQQQAQGFGDAGRRPGR